MGRAGGCGCCRLRVCAHVRVNRSSSLCHSIFLYHSSICQARARDHSNRLCHSTRVCGCGRNSHLCHSTLHGRGHVWFRLRGYVRGYG